MNILFVAPYPLSHIRVRSYGFVRHLAKRHAVTVLALCTDERAVVEMQRLKREGITITAIREKHGRQFLRGLSALGTDLPFQVAFGAIPQLRRAIVTHLATGHFDVLHIEALRTLGALPDILPIPTIWDEVDCMSQAYELGARFGATAMLRLIGQTEARRVRAFERLQLRRFHQVLVVSERDRQALLDLATDSSDATREHTLADITVLPNGIDQSYFRPYSGPRQPARLVFSGTMNFHANVAGLFTLVEQIMPRIWEHRPDTQLTIVGSNPSAKIRQLERDPRITVTGFVPDIRSYIAEAQVAVSPLPYATGIQNKILEAMALGTPVVTSSSGSAGLQAVPSRDLLVADAPEAFAASVLNLMDDQILWNRLSESGRAYISNYHNWDTIVEQLTSIYCHAIDATKRIDAQPLLLRKVGGKSMQSDLEHEQLLASAPDLQITGQDLLFSDQENLSFQEGEVGNSPHQPVYLMNNQDTIIAPLSAGKRTDVAHRSIHRPLIWRLTAMVGDVVIFGSLLLIVLLILHFHPTLLVLDQGVGAWHPKLMVGCLALLSWSVAVRITQAYDLHNLYGRLASPLCALLAFCMMLIFLLLLGDPFVTNGTVYLDILLFCMLMVVPILCTWRVILATVMNFPRFRPWAIIIGANSAGEAVATELKSAKRYTTNVLGYISVNAAEAEEGRKKGLPILGDQQVLRYLVQQGQVDTIIMAIDYRTNPGLLQEAIELAQHGVSVVPMMKAYERTSGKISVQHIGDQWYVALPSELTGSPLYLVWRKTLDIVFGLLGIAVLLLLLSVLAPCIYLDSPGPIFYKQERVGRNGRKFIIYKFRSMHTDSEFTGQAQWASEADARVTRVGRFMRATHLDELPQVWNILRGEMSLVGPRPERQEFVSILEKSMPFYRCRLSARPGLTGWAQVKYGYANSNQDALEKLQYDLYYIKHQSFMLDIFIILRTVVEVFLHRGT